LAAEQHDPEWYYDREVPQRLLNNLAELPIVPEQLLDGRIPDAGRIEMFERRRTGSLTPREAQCLALMSHGMTTEMVAQTLGIAFYTVMTYLKKARFALRAKNTAHAIAIALREGIIE